MREDNHAGEQSEAEETSSEAREQEHSALGEEGRFGEVEPSGEP